MASVPRAIGPYVVEGELGRGGMGVVYAVRSPDGRALALKLIAGGVDPIALERFRREAEALARVAHPHVVRVHAAGEHERAPYLVSERVEGRPLDVLLRERGPLPPAEAARIARAIAEAVAALHRAGVLHRDLKPANVILRPDGTPVLLDLGLARLRGAQTLTQTGMVLGTPGYMAPEQADGGSTRLQGERVDVYGLGALLFALLAARAPFVAATYPELLRQILWEQASWPDEAAVPEALRAVAARALAKEPEDRYPSAAALAEELERYLAGAPLAAARAQGRGGRRALAAAGLALLALVIAALGVIARRPEPGEAASGPALELSAPSEAERRAGRLWRRDLVVAGSVVHAAGAVRGAARVRLLRAGAPRPLAEARARPGETFRLEVPLASGPHELRLELELDGARLEERLRLLNVPPWYDPVRDAPLPLPRGVELRDEDGVYEHLPDRSLLVWVPPGRFTMGTPAGPEVAGDEVPAHPVVISRGFFVGRTEVTWGQYARFCRSEGAELPEAGRAADPEGPAAGVTWDEADAYCRWAGLRLLSEGEWEYAARGPEVREFPWGAEALPADACNLRGTTDGFAGPAPVGRFPRDRSPFGLLDMGGNVHEWTADGPWPYPPGEQVDPTHPFPDEHGQRTVRGASFRDLSMHARVCNRVFKRADERHPEVGFRTALDPR